MLRPYYKVFVNSISVSLTYRWNVLAGIFTQLFQFFIAIFVWKSIFAQNTLIQNYTFENMTTYLILTSLLGVSFSTTHIFRLSSLVRKGTLNSYLLRPYNFLGDSFAVFVGSKVIEIIISVFLVIILLVLGVIAFNTISGTAILLVFSNLILFFLFGSLLGTLSFWIIQMWPMKPLYTSLMALLGGNLFPLDLLPEAIRQIFEYLPFSLFGFVNARALQGALSQSDVLKYLIASLSWILICFMIYSLLWRLGLKRYEGVNT